MRELAALPAGYRRPARRLSTRRKLGISRASVFGAGFGVFVAVIGALLSPSPQLVFGSGLLLSLIFLTLWQENEPPLLLFPALYQWLAVATKPLMTIFLQVPVNALSEHNFDLGPGVTLGLLGVGALAIGMRLGSGRSRIDWNAALRNEAMMLSSASCLKVAIGAILIGHFLLILMPYTGGARQLFLALAGVRFIGLFTLAYWCFANRKGFVYLGVVALAEIFVGLTGFFSDFRVPIFIIAFAAIAVGHRPKVRDALLMGALVAALIFLGSFWSSIKMDYRNFVSGSTMEQIVTVPLGDRVDYLVRAAETFDGERFIYGFDQLLRRQSYIDFTSAVMAYVPEVLPHEHGQRVGRTVVHVLTPRILFPNKPPTEFDTETTAHYTGMALQIREGTSISIGYVGELYIDFGLAGAVVACLGLGLLFGFGYRMLRQRGRGSVLLTYGARASALVVLMPFDTALIKYVGGAGVAFISAYLLQRLAVPWLSRQLRAKRSFRQPAAAVSVV